MRMKILAKREEKCFSDFYHIGSFVDSKTILGNIVWLSGSEKMWTEIDFKGFSINLALLNFFTQI